MQILECGKEAIYAKISSVERTEVLSRDSLEYLRTVNIASITNMVQQRGESSRRQCQRGRPKIGPVTVLQGMVRILDYSDFGGKP